MRAVLQAQINKTDRNDARGMASEIQSRGRARLRTTGPSSSLSEIGARRPRARRSRIGLSRRPSIRRSAWEYRHSIQSASIEPVGSKPLPCKEG
jgi:hypothetical protein